jgi:putative nucleotidyltransferase with HDIG domain
MDTSILVPDYIRTICQIFQKNSFQLFLVGGSLRDMLLFKQSHDWDMTTNATPQEMLTLFPDAFYDNTFGTVGIPITISNENSSIDSVQKKEVVEITTFRSESEYTDRRHPEKIAWGKTIEEDLQRRDFTINAMALSMADIDSKQHIEITEIIDPHGGREDLEKRLIRAVGNANSRFKEDALRIMRAIRFAAQLGFTIEDMTWNALKEDAALLPAISAERIRDELLKTLGSLHPFEGVMLLKNAGLLKYILPELLEGIDVSQVRPGRHHTEDVFMHNLLSLKFCPSTDPVVRFATLLHDIGKPQVVGADEQGLVTFYNHEIVGAKIARQIADRLHFSKKQREKIVMLIRWHMFTVDEHTTDAAVRRFIRRVGVDNIRDMIDLRIADRLGSGTATAESWRLKLFKQRVEEQLAPAPFSITDLALDGNDIMKELNIKPSKTIGLLLQKLFEEVDENLELNRKDYLIQRIHELSKEMQ